MRYCFSISVAIQCTASRGDVGAQQCGSIKRKYEVIPHPSLNEKLFGKCSQASLVKHDHRLEKKSPAMVEENTSLLLRQEQISRALALSDSH